MINDQTGAEGFRVINNYLRIYSNTCTKVFFYPSEKLEMASLTNSEWQNRKERPNRSTKNRYMAEKANHREAELLNLTRRRAGFASRRKIKKKDYL